ncbi:hypothetical protein [Achromobacter ruhlandii]|uniref:hypothetical protein n=1 Tax=Achromobacter ruhlandii TaxID=72557 RepID=UPI0007BED236|nr:hypothetical protein [Achromobacter ruhlandii]
MSNTPESPITVTVDHDPRGVSVGVWQGSHCIYSGAHPLPAAPASPVSTVEQGEVVAWMDPTTLDVISAERKASWLSDYGAGGAVKAATYTRALGDLRPAPAAGDALDWTPISERLPEIPADAPGKRIHVLAGRYSGGHWYSWSMWYGPRGAELRFYEEFTDENADGDDVELIKDDDCATHWRYMPAGPALSAQRQGDA